MELWTHVVFNNETKQNGHDDPQHVAVLVDWSGLNANADPCGCSTGAPAIYDPNGSQTMINPNYGPMDADGFSTLSAPWSTEVGTLNRNVFVGRDATLENYMKSHFARYQNLTHFTI